MLKDIFNRTPWLNTDLVSWKIKSEKKTKRQREIKRLRGIVRTCEKYSICQWNLKEREHKVGAVE